MRKDQFRPKLKIEKDSFDKLIELLGMAAVFLLIGLPIYYYSTLPETIPTHFGPDGTPDGFGDKESIWILPFLGTAIYVGLHILNQFPHVFNYIVQINTENARQQYTIATKMIRVLGTVLVGLFTYINYASIQTALGNQNGLGIAFMLTFLVALLAPMGYYIYQSIRKNET